MISMGWLALLITVILFVYSYLVYHRLETGGNEISSPPFDGGTG